MTSFFRDETCGAARLRTSRLGRNDDGAIMVIGVFMAIILVGILYYLAGIGTTLLYRERLQDAADAVSLGTAIGHARGMNLIVFLNLVMAALVAILLALKVIELLLTGLVLVLTAISWFFPPAGVAIPIVENARSFVSNVHDTAEDIVDQLLVALNGIEQAVKIITPAASVGAAMLVATDKYGDAVKAAFAIPPRLQLPVEDDEYSRLCDESENILRDLIEQSVGAIPLVGKVISAALGGLISAVSAVFCKGEVADLSYDVEIDRTLPLSEDGRQCEVDKSNMETDTDACTRWDEELMARRPDDNGDCAAADDRNLCRQNGRNARAACAPPKRVTSYSYSIATVRETVVYDPSIHNWASESLEYEPGMEAVNVATAASARADIGGVSGRDIAPGELEGLEPEADARKPCQPAESSIDPYFLSGMSARQRQNLWTDWNPDPGSDADPKPVCSQRPGAMLDLPRIPDRPLGAEQGVDTLPASFQRRHDITYEAVKQIYGCSEKDTIPMNIPVDVDLGTGQDDRDDKVPQKMEEGAALGSDDFQMRGVAIGQGHPVLSEKKLRISAFHRDPGQESWVGLARGVGRLSIAQAEYYYNHTGGEDAGEWMWNMKWRARVVRFRLPSDEDEEEGSDSSDSSDSPASLDIGPVSLDLGSLGLESMPSTDMSQLAGELPGDGPGLDVFSYLVVH